MDDKKEAPELAPKSGVIRWLDNFWYHYKWHTVIIGFFLLVIIVSVAQCSSEEASDITVSFAGNYALSDREQKELKTVFGSVLPEDFDGNGAKTAAFAQFSIYTEEELVQLYTYQDEEGASHVDSSGLSSARHYNTERLQSLQNYVMTGDCAVWLVSPYVYETVFRDKVHVTQTFSLKDTSLYRYYDAVQLLPAETVVVLVQPVMGYMSKQENYRKAEDYISAILNFTAP